MRVSWPVDARKLRSSDTQVVSAAFELFTGVPFKLFVKAAAKGEKRGQAGFKAAKGRGSVELKYIGASDPSVFPLTLRMYLKSFDGKVTPEVVTTHDFSTQMIYTTSLTEASWDLNSAVHPSSQTFTVCLEVFANSKLQSHV